MSFLASALWSGLLAAGFCLAWYRLKSLQRTLETLHEQTATLHGTVMQLADQTSLDVQTGLRAFRVFAEDASLLCRTRVRLAVIVVELDLERFADCHRDWVADLRRAAQALDAKHRRIADRLYRLRGAEFALLYVVDDRAEAQLHAERCFQALESASLPCSVGIGYADPVTCPP